MLLTKQYFLQTVVKHVSFKYFHREVYNYFAGLIEFIPMAGTDVKLIYADLTPLVQERQMMQAMQGEPGSNRDGNQGSDRGDPRGS